MTTKLLFGKTIFLATMLFTSIYTFAFDFTVNNINYTITSTTAKEVKVDVTPAASGSINIPSTVTNGGTTYTVTSIGNYAFSGCTSLASITFTLPSSITSIGNNAFDSCAGLTSITLPSSITSIGNWAFVFCSSLTSITLPSSITSIGEGVFVSCSSLTSIILPSSITSIGDEAFANCSSLASVTVNWTTPLNMSSSLNAFANIPSATLYVPNTTRSAYQIADVWKNFSSIVESALATTDFNKEKEKVFFDGSSNTLKLATAKPFGEYEIYDATGRTILKGNAKSGEISLNAIPKGIYILRAKNLASAVKFRK